MRNLLLLFTHTLVFSPSSQVWSRLTCPTLPFILPWAHIVYSLPLNTPQLVLPLGCITPLRALLTLVTLWLVIWSERMQDYIVRIRCKQNRPNTHLIRLQSRVCFSPECIQNQWRQLVMTSPRWMRLIRAEGFGRAWAITATTT